MLKYKAISCIKISSLHTLVWISKQYELSPHNHNIILTPTKFISFRCHLIFSTYSISHNCASPIFFIKSFSKMYPLTLAGVAHLVGVSSHNQRVVGSIPGQGTYLGFGFSPWSWSVQEATNWCSCLSLKFLSLPSSLSKRAMKKMSSGED